MNSWRLEGNAEHLKRNRLKIIFISLCANIRRMLLCLPLKIEMFVCVFRLVEEMASMQKCLELGELYCGQAYGLCRFLAHRFTWLQQRFVKWRKREHKFEIPLPAVGMSDLKLGAIHIRIRMLAALIPLRALFFTYISKYPTTHPISEVWQWLYLGVTVDNHCHLAPV